MQIIPAILPKDYSELSEKIDLVKSFTDMVQIDICDGQFTQSVTWPYKKPDTHFDAMLDEVEGMPGWEDVDFEIHLMVKNPEEIITDWIAIGAERILFHPASTKNLDTCISLAKGIVEVGLVFGIDDPIITVPDIDVIQLMGIEHIGMQGQPFSEKVLEKIKEVKQKYPDTPISIDGGVNLETVELLKDVDRLVIGSGLYDSENIPNQIQKFRSIIGK